MARTIATYSILDPLVNPTIERVEIRDIRRRRNANDLGGLFKVYNSFGEFVATAYGYEIMVSRV